LERLVHGPPAVELQLAAGRGKLFQASTIAVSVPIRPSPAEANAGSAIRAA
jgi:hypothetical protein